MVCRSGARSGRAAAKLVSDGYLDVTNLDGGTVGWAGLGLPTVPHENNS